MNEWPKKPSLSPRWGNLYIYEVFKKEKIYWDGDKQS